MLGDKGLLCTSCDCDLCNDNSTDVENTSDEQPGTLH